MARRIGDPETLAFAIDGHIPVVESPANTRELLDQSTELLRIALEVGDLERIFEAHDHRLERLFELGEMGAASAELGAMARVAERLRQPTQSALVTGCRARLALHEGRLEDAAELIDAGSAATGEGSDTAKLAFTFQLQRHLLERELGRLGAAAQLVRRSIDAYPDRPIWRCALAQLEAELAHEDEARRALDALAADRFSAILFDDSWLASMCFLAEATALLGDAERAAVLYERLLPYADRVAVTYSEISLGSVARYLGLLAAAIGRPSERSCTSTPRKRRTGASAPGLGSTAAAATASACRALAPRQDALGPKDHHEHQQQAVERVKRLGHVEVEAHAPRHVVDHVRDQPVVDEAQRHGADEASDRGHASEHDHAEDEDREVDESERCLATRLIAPRNSTDRVPGLGSLSHTSPRAASHDCERLATRALRRPEWTTSKRLALPRLRSCFARAKTREPSARPHAWTSSQAQALPALLCRLASLGRRRVRSGRTSAARLEDDERDLALRAFLVAAVAAEVGNGLRPQPGAFVGVGHACADRSALAADLHGRLGVRAEVVIPAGVLWVATLGRDDDDVAAILDIGQRRRSHGPAVGADMIEQQHRRRTREAVADQPARRAVHQRVGSHQSTQRRPGRVREAHHIHPPSLRAETDHSRARGAYGPRSAP